MRQSRRLNKSRPSAATTIVAAALSVAGVLPVAVVGVGTAAAAPAPGYTVSQIPTGGVSSVAVDSATNTVYFGGFGKLTVVDGSHNTVATTVALPATSSSRVAVNTVTDTVYVLLPATTAASAPTVQVIDGKTDTVLPPITLPVGSVPADIAVDSSTDTVYVSEGGADAVAVINGSTNKVTTTVSISGMRPGELAVDQSSDVVWVTDARGFSVYAISGASNTVTPTVTFSNPTVDSIAVNPVSDTVYVGMRDTAVDVIDGASGTVKTTIALGSAFPASVTGIAVDPGSGTVFASSLNGPAGSGDVGNTWMINGSSDAVADTLPRGGLQVAVNTTTGSAYESNFA